MARNGPAQPGGRWPAAMLLFLLGRTRRDNSPAGWANAAMRALEAAGKGELIGRLDAELAQNFRRRPRAPGHLLRVGPSGVLSYGCPNGQLQAFAARVPQDGPDEDGTHPRRSARGKPS